MKFTIYKLTSSGRENSKSSDLDLDLDLDVDVDAASTYGPIQVPHSREVTSKKPDHVQVEVQVHVQDQEDDG